MGQHVRSAIGRHQSNIPREETAAAVAALLAEGATRNEASEALGISGSYCNSLVNDPEGVADAARKDRNRGTCESCGAPTCGSAGRNHAPAFCFVCAPAAYRTWTKAGMIFVLQEIHRLTGEVPKAAIALHGGYVGLPIDSQGSLNSLVNTSQRLFGSWNNAIAAAGMTPRKSGHREFK